MRLLSGTDRAARQRIAKRRVAAARSARCRCRRCGRPGLTLIELLVVIIILTTLVAAALPIMAPNTETRRLREAARSLQTVVTTAQTKATELGRPYGIWLERQSATTAANPPDPRDMGAVLTVYFCEEPRPFAGYSHSSGAILVPRPTTSYPRGHVVAFGRHNPHAQSADPRFQVEPLPPAMFRPGDRVIVRDAVYQFTETVGDFNQTEMIGNERFLQSNKDGWYYVTYEGNPKSSLHLVYNPRREPLNKFPLWTVPQSFQILRQPQKVGDPLQLPAGTAIDLEASGDRSFFYHDPRRTGGSALQVGGGRNYNLAPVVVLFSPGGAVHRVIRNDGDIQNEDSLQKVIQAPSDGTIYLMVGRRERTGESFVDSSGTPLGDPRLTSWLDPESLWVSIAPQTGRVVTEQNRFIDSTITATAAGNWDYADLAAQRRQAREFARQSQNMGGR